MGGVGVDPRESSLSIVVSVEVGDDNDDYEGEGRCRFHVRRAC